MKRGIVAVILFIITLSANNAFAQIKTSVGDDFWVAFMENQDLSVGDSSYCLFATSTRRCTMTASNPNTGWSTSITVMPNILSMIWVPLNQAYPTSSGVPLGKGIHVTSTEDITLYAMTRGYPSMDYTNIFPTHMLRDEYLIQTYPSVRYSSEFAIVAAEDSTVVDIELIDSYGQSTTPETQTYTLLHAGELVQICSEVPGDLSGTRVKARGHKRIAVFNGDQCVYVPYQHYRLSCDLVVEQAMPTNYWGKHFVVIGANTSLKDRVRITSAEPNCEIRINDVLRTVLGRGETFEYELDWVDAVDEIVTSKRAMVYLYFASHNGDGLGDPAMTTIPPIEQGINEITFPTLTIGNIRDHYLLVICNQASVDSIMFDGTSISNHFEPVAFTEYMYLRRSISEGVHTIVDNSNMGFVAYLYGIGNRESYGYTIGTAAVDLRRPQLYVNNQLINNCMNICDGDSVEFNVSLPSAEIVSTEWQLGDGSPTTAVNPLTYRYSEPGRYDVSVAVEFILDPFTNEVLHDTLTTCIIVNPNYLFDYFDTVAEPNLPHLHQEHYYTSSVADDTIHLTSSQGCDSTMLYNLFVWPNQSSAFDTTVCVGNLPMEWRGKEFDANKLNDTLFYTDIHGADSTVSLLVRTIKCDTVKSGLWVPNMFTPTLAENNRFALVCFGILEANVVVFNRGGMKVAEFDGLTESWDGTFGGVPCKQETYVYQVTYRTNIEPKMVLKKFGSVTLIR